ncbi:putative methyltransferase [Medicago truncatula]|uniref:Putative methyltransferase n=1 Tax=Medicago truncatula TaxID=3880 RepID=A0A396HFK0_MEDTR|nr:putative methyltransferase [Medicago truncatula]
MSSYSNGKENHVVEIHTPQIDHDSSNTLPAMVLGSTMVFPAILNAAIELKLFDIIASNGGFMSAYEIALKLPTQHSDLPNRLDRMLCVLAILSSFCFHSHQRRWYDCESLSGHTFW